MAQAGLKLGSGASHQIPHRVVENKNAKCKSGGRANTDPRSPQTDRWTADEQVLATKASMRTEAGALFRAAL